MNDNALNILKNIVDNNVENYLGMPPIIDKPKSKHRLFRSTKPKRNKEKEKKLKKISKISKRRNRGGQ